MSRVVTRLASITGALALLAGLPALAAADAAGSTGRPPGPLARLDRLLARHDARLAAAVLPDAVGAPQAAGHLQGTLFDVSARTRASGWAVGFRCPKGCTQGSLNTLAERWNGRSWTAVPSPTKDGFGYLNSVSAVSAGNAWARGFDFVSSGAVRTLILHWNGVRWAAVPSPDPSTDRSAGINVLASITTVSASDAWAGGTYCARACGHSGEVDRALMAHWNGTKWSVVPIPSADARSDFAEVTSVSAASAADVWAVGYYAAKSGNRTMTMHWNGSRWSVVASPDPLPGDNRLSSVQTVSATSAWAVGHFCARHCNRLVPPDRTLILHWNGVRWNRVASNPTPVTDGLTGVTSSSARSAWASGSHCVRQCSSRSPGYRPLILHWNGVRWSRAATPDLGASAHYLSSTSAVRSGRAWVAGFGCAQRCTTVRPLIEAWNGRRWAVQ
jgi:hypothetical protein